MNQQQMVVDALRQGGQPQGQPQPHPLYMQYVEQTLAEGGQPIPEAEFMQMMQQRQMQAQQPQGGPPQGMPPQGMPPQGM